MQKNNVLKLSQIKMQKNFFFILVFIFKNDEKLREREKFIYDTQ